MGGTVHVVHVVAASLIRPWFLWWPPAESHYNVYDHSVVGYVSHAHCIVFLYSFGNKIITITSLSDVANCYAIFVKNTHITLWSFYLKEIMFTRQETIGYLASCIHHFLYVNTNTPSVAVRIPNSNIFFNSVLQLIFSIFEILVILIASHHQSI